MRGCHIYLPDAKLRCYDKMAVAAPRDFPDGVSGTLTDSPGGISLRVMYSISPGEIDIDGEVSGDLTISRELSGLIDRLSGGVIENTVRIRYTTEGLADLRNTVNNISRALPSDAAVSAAALQNLVSGNVPRLENELRGEELPVQATFASVTDQATNAFNNFFGGGGGGGGTATGGTIGQSTVGFSNSASFTPVTVPDIDATRAIVANAPDPTLVVRAEPTTPLQRAPADILGRVPEVRIEVPTWAFFNFVSSGNISCAQLHPDIDSRLAQLASVTERAQNQLETDLSALENIAGSIPTLDTGAIGTGRVDQVADQIRGLGSGVLTQQIDARTRNNLVSQLESVQPNIVNPADIRDSFDELESDIEDVGGGRCGDDLAERLDSLRPRVNRIEDLQPQVQQLANSMADVLPGDVDRDTQISPDVELGCSDISRSLRNRARGFSSAARSFTGGGRAQELISEGESVLSDLRNDTDPANPCRSDLIQQVRSGLTTVRQAGGRERDFGGTPIRDITPCNEEYPVLSDEVNEFFDDATSLDPNSSTSQVDNLLSQGRELVNRINSNVDRGRCAEDFSSTVRAGLQSINRRQGQVRIVSGDSVQELPEERQERLNEIISQLEGITQGFADQSEELEQDIPDFQ